FYLALAGSFSLELGLPAGWSICEEADDEVLREEALERLLEAEEEAEILTTLYQRLTRGQAKRGVRQELLDVVNGLYGIRQGTGPDSWNKVAVPPRLPASELAVLLAGIEAFDLSNQARMQKPRADDLARVRSQAWTDLLEKGLSG